VKDLEEEKKWKSLKRLSEIPGRILDKSRVLLWVPNPSSEKFQFSPLTRFKILQKVNLISVKLKSGLKLECEICLVGIYK
jgi:hypothetical protein